MLYKRHMTAAEKAGHVFACNYMSRDNNRSQRTRLGVAAAERASIKLYGLAAVGQFTLTKKKKNNEKKDKEGKWKTLTLPRLLLFCPCIIVVSFLFKK